MDPIADAAPDVDIAAELSKFAADTEPAAAPAEPAPEPVKAEPAPTPAPATEPRTVPLASLLEERSKWKGEVEELKSTVAKGNERLEKLFQALNTEQPKPVPQFDSDPLGNLRHVGESAQNEVAQLKAWKEQVENQNRQQLEINKFAQSVHADEQRFAGEHSDYWQAAEHVRKFHRDQLVMFNVPADQVDHVLQQQLVGIAATAMKGGKSPAEITYELAKRYGYKASNGEGKAQPSLETLAKGVEAAKSVPAGSEGLPITLEALAKMSDDEVERLMDDAKEWKRLASQL